MKKGSAKAVPAGKRTAAEKLQYVKKNWQLYVFFLLPALLLTIIFKYVPMGGVLIAFEDYNVIDGVFGSKWVGLEYFRRFLASPDFMNYLVNTLKLSIYGLLWGFPIPIILALLLNQIRRAGIRKKIQLLIYAPNFISVIVLCGMVRMFLSPVGPLNKLIGSDANWMTMPAAFRTIYIDFSSGNSAGSISNVQERICGKKFLQCYFSHYHVFRWRNDPDFYPDQSVASGKYNLGNPASGCV